jgi:CubicO group peptidase (beta-lactamase class C family)
MAAPLFAALRPDNLEKADDVLAKAVASGQVKSAVIHVRQRDMVHTRSFGQATDDSMFLLGSISKPICMTALMTLFDQGKFRLDDPLKKFVPQFTGDGRDSVTMKHLLTHVSGLPDQLSENNQLRKSHASLAEFVDHAIRTPLSFAPGTRYQYSSMAILLASEVGRIISGVDILSFVDRVVLQALGMKHSAIGLGRFKIDDFTPVQIEFAAPEAGAGDPTAKEWDWNSSYWRRLGAPWGGVHASAADVGRLLDEFMSARGAVVKPETARMMITNQNPAELESRGLGFDVGPSLVKGGTNTTFGHGGSTGTIAWADPANQTICVVLTSLPGRAVNPHPRDIAAERVAIAVKSETR